MSTTGLLVLILVYLSVTLYLGYIGYQRTRSTKDYLIAGGDAHPFLMALAYGSTFISTSAIVGFGGVAALYGMGILWLTFLNIFVGIFIAFVVFGKRTIKVGNGLGVHTFPELLGKKYDSQYIRKVSAAVIALAMPVYAAAVMIGGARFLETALGANYTWCLLAFAAIVALYVMTGGLKGILYTDALQGSIMFIGMVILLVYTYVTLDGVSGAHTALTELGSKVPESLAANGHQGWTSMPVLGSESWWVLVSTIVMGVGIGVLAQPQLVVRFLTVKGSRELNRAVGVGGVFILMMTGVAFVVGALTNVYFDRTLGKIALAASVSPATGKPNVDSIIPMYINASMPEWFTYVFMLTLLAAAMSTLSGQFHAIGSALSHDLYRRSSLAINRLGILAALVITIILGLYLPVSIVAIATAFFMGLCAVAFLPSYTAALFWPRATRAGVAASITVGIVVDLFAFGFLHAKEATVLGLSQALLGRPTLASFPWTVIDPLIIALPLSTAVLVGVSLLTNHSSPAVGHTKPTTQLKQPSAG